MNTRCPRMVAMMGFLIAMTSPGIAQTRMASDVVAAGAQSASGGGVTVRGTVGQIVIGRTTASTGTALQGFWYRPSQGVSAAVLSPGTVTEAIAIQVEPNPCVDVAHIQFFVPVAGRVSIELFDALGARAAMLLDEQRENGVYRIPLDVAELASGSYTARIVAGDYRRTVAIMVTR